MSVTKAFDKLLDRRRALGWRINTFSVATNQKNLRDQSTMTVELTPFSFLAVPLVIDSERRIAANGDVANLNLENKRSLNPLLISESEAKQYDRVRAVGRRIRSTFSWSKTDGTMIRSWDSNDTSKYSASLSAGPDYPKRRDQKEKVDAEYRKTDRFKDTWALFKLPDFWTGFVGKNDPAIPGQTPFSAIVDSTGRAKDVYRSNVRFLSHIPIDLDSSDVFKRVADGKRAPFAIIKAAGGLPAHFVEVENLDSSTGLEKDSRGSGEFDWSGKLSVVKRDAAVRIKVSGAPQHVMGDSEFVKLEHDGDLVELSWENLVVTAQIETDDFVEQIFPPTGALDGVKDIIRTLRVDMGDEYGLDFVADGTVVGVKDGKLVYAPKRFIVTTLPTEEVGSIGFAETGFIRDDRPKLFEIAKMAQAWYSRRKRSVLFTIDEIFNPVVIGGYLLSSGPFADEWVAETDLESVVTQVNINLRSLPPVTKITTAYAELDFAQIVSNF